MSESRHPLHPVLVHFPIAAWILALLLDIASLMPGIGQRFPMLDLSATSYLLLWIGLIFVLPVMAAGVFDYLFLEEEATATINRHILWMSTASLLFLAVAVWRFHIGAFDAEVTIEILAFELLGAAYLVVGGRAAASVVFRDFFSYGHRGQSLKR